MRADFWKFWTGETISNFGSSITQFALPLLLFKLTGSAVSLGLGFAMFGLPHLRRDPKPRRTRQARRRERADTGELLRGDRPRPARRGWAAGVHPARRPALCRCRDVPRLGVHAVAHRAAVQRTARSGPHVDPCRR